MPIRLRLPDGAISGTAGPTLRLIRPDDFYQRLGVGGLIGFGEAYQAGDWATDDLAELLVVLATHVEKIVPRQLHWLRRFHTHKIPHDTANTLGQSRRNIEAHYDLSNDLFREFLDETMSYSSALFGPGDREPAWGDLADAQRRKIDRLLDLTQVGAGARVLEIGTGWGELSMRAAQRGAKVHTVTLSQQQKALAEQRIAAAGLADRIDVRLCDYRDIPGQAAYDAVVSVEMIEAVGEEFWPTYFAALRRLVAPTGRIGLQAITMPHHRMLVTRNTHTWIQKYIFPGGLIPSPEVIENECALPLVDRHEFGADYARTLRLWRARFLSNFQTIREYGFDEVFRRTWELYLAYSEAGFASGYLNVGQYVFRGAT
jgi:cyclopropane-fatty-acyl-phospholipid synthase